MAPHLDRMKAVRLPVELVERAQALVAAFRDSELAKTPDGLRVRASAASVIRVALVRGLAELERELVGSTVASTASDEVAIHGGNHA